MSELLYSLPAWDLHNLGSLVKLDFELVSDACESPEMDDCSEVFTGYLEDALIESGERRKRRRLLFENPSKSFDHKCSKNDWGLFVTPHVNTDELKSGFGYFEDPISTVYESPDTSINSSDKSYVRDISPADTSSSLSCNKNKRLVTKVVYPFGLVKPGGREDDVTLNDINKRILMPPVRPVRHPVGDFASRPCVSTCGPSLSGKTVVTLTRIQTQGKGTITIIRTKG